MNLKNLRANMSKILAFDTETTGLHPAKGHRPFLISTFDGEQARVGRNIFEFSDALADEQLPKVAHGLKFDLLMLDYVGQPVKGELNCTLIAKHLIDENSSLSLDYCAKTYTDEVKYTDMVDQWFKINGYTKENRDYTALPENIITPYAQQDTVATWKVWQKFKPILEEQGLMKVYRQEIELVNVLIRMYKRGVKIDTEYLKWVKEKYFDELKVLEQEVYQDAGTTFDILSSKQLADILIQAGVHLPLTKKQNFQTNKQVLEDSDHPLPAKIIQYRHLSKFISTYCDGLLSESVNSTIHANFNSCGAVTGRFSCSEPNLQNIPKEEDEVEEGKKDTSIRGAFIAREGYTNFYIDWKQQEYRVFAHYSRDQKLIDAVNADYDFHVFIMEEINKYIIGHKLGIKPIKRKDAKTINFGLLFGMGGKKLAVKLGIPYQDALALKNIYFKLFPSLKHQDPNTGNWVGFMPEVEEVIKARARENNNLGYTYNIFGRRRRLEPKFSYIAVNAIIQGGCADYVKNKMIEIDKYLVTENIPAQILLQIHDELIIEVKDGHEYCIKQIQKIMEDSLQLFKVKLAVDIKYSKTSWKDAKEYKYE